MNIAQTLLATYQDPKHENHNDLRAFLQSCLENSLTADQHFDGGTIQYSFKDSSSVMVQTFFRSQPGKDSIELDLKITCQN